jgi:endonuclease YncB( thermonuclease family)
MEPKPFTVAPDDPGPDDLGEMLEAKVLKVFDGDGFLADVWHPTRGKWISHVPFRFAFIDAPEMDQPVGVEAGEFLHRLIAGKTLKLDPIGKQSTGYLPIDQYKRMLCMAFLTEQMPVGEIEYLRNGSCHVGVVKVARLVTRNIELEMIINGWAWVIEQYSFDREEEYLAAQDNARIARRGLWAMDNPEPPWQFKQKLKRRRKTNEQQSSLFVAQCEVEGCEGRLVERMGARGPFLGCSNFPRCRFSRTR